MSKPASVKVCDVTIGVSWRVVAETLCAAIESGSSGIGYWAQIGGYIKPPSWPGPKDPGPDGVTLDRLNDEGTGTVYRHIDYPLNSGGSIKLVDAEGEGGGPWTLDREALIRGVRLMADKHPKHFADMVDETGDADTGDVLVQLSVLGEITYG